MGPLHFVASGHVIASGMRAHRAHLDQIKPTRLSTLLLEFFLSGSDEGWARGLYLTLSDPRPALDDPDLALFDLRPVLLVF